MTALARFAWTTLLWNVIVILWGAFVRATGSGAGCGAHWPLCNGEVVPRAPALETIVEFTHRATSGLALVMVAILAVWVFRKRPKGHPARAAAAATVVFILVEAAVGAGLVLFGLVAENESVARALFMAGHLANTFMLLAALALTAHWCTTDAPLRRDTLRRDGWVFALTFALLLIVGKSGAVAALGDTLYPAQSLLGGLAQDLSPTTTLLVRLRLLHPMLAVAGALAVAFAAARVLQSTDEHLARQWAWVTAGLALAQVGAGILNVILLAPVWMQIVHLLLADLLWIALVLLAARALTLAPPARPPERPTTVAA
jgi:cytochrome c oxidase assembly protein subunit 15